MRQASELPQPSIVDIDPEDPSQLLDDAGQFSIIDLETEAQPQAEADAELDAAVASTAEGIDVVDQTDLDVSADGESYEDEELGEHMFETLEKKMAEGDAAPESEIEIDDEDSDSDPQGTPSL